MESNEELAKVLVELIKTNPHVQQALWDSVCGCPNLVVQY